MAITQTFSAPPTPPSSTDKTNFRVRYDAFLAYIQTLGTGLSAFITQANALETNVNAKEASAVAAQIAAAASANFQGVWSSATAYTIGQSVSHNGITYRALLAGTNQNPATATTYWTPVAPSYGSISGTFTTTANTWYRIAQSPVNQTPVDARFNISWGVSGQYGSVRIAASSMYGTSPCLSQISYAKYGANGITQARIVYHTTATGNYAYLEVMFAGAITNVVVTVEAFDVTGWSLLPPSTAGSIPAGYTSLTYAFKSTITPGTYPVVTVDSDGSVTSGSNALPNGTTATTQAAGDNSTDVATTAYVDGKMVLSTAVASTSGTAIDFTGIPAWVKRITVMANGVSTNGISNPIIQLGSGSPQTTGYKGSAWTGSGSAANNSNGFLVVNSTAATDLHHFVGTLIKISANTWAFSLVGGYEHAYIKIGGGSVTLSGVLDRVRITTQNGTDTFDAGTINIMYEG